MPIKTKIKYGVDFGMIAVLPLLMAYSLVGEAEHEWLGVGMFILFLLHHILNFKWLKNLWKGKYSGFRILQTVLVVLIFLTMLGSMVSGIALSRYVFRFLPNFSVFWAQGLHLFSAYWGFLLMSLHLGLHWSILLGIFRRSHSAAHTKSLAILLQCTAGVIAGLGVAAFIQNRLIDYLFLRTHFVMLDFNITLTSFLLDYLCILGLFVWVGYYLGKAVQKTEKTKKKTKQKGSI